MHSESSKGPPFGPRPLGILHASDRSGTAGTLPGTRLLVTCAGCSRLHAVGDLLAFNPICPACSRSTPGY